MRDSIHKLVRPMRIAALATLTIAGCAEGDSPAVGGGDELTATSQIATAVTAASDLFPFSDGFNHVTRVVLRDSQNRIQELSLGAVTGGWHAFDMTTDSGVGVAATGNPKGYVRADSHTSTTTTFVSAVVFRGVNNHIY